MEFNTKGENLLVLKSEYFDTMGKLMASLKSAKKGYVAFKDSSIVSRAVISSVMISKDELLKLDKPKEPLYWTKLKEIEAEKDYIIGDVETKGSELYAIGFMAGQEPEQSANIKKILSDYRLFESEVKIQTLPNGYCTITRKV